MASATAVSKQKIHRGAGDEPGKQTHRRHRTRQEDTQALLISQEIMRLVDASQEGRLSERGKAEQFEGVHREMMQGINEMLDAILLPIGEGNRILAQISNGKIDELIAQTYKGDHEKMKQAVNNVAVVLQGLQKEMARLTEPRKKDNSPSAASRSSSRARMPRSCAASTPCWTRSCCRSAKATAFWRRFRTARSTN